MHMKQKISPTLRGQANAATYGGAYVSLSESNEMNKLVNRYVAGLIRPNRVVLEKTYTNKYSL